MIHDGIFGKIDTSNLLLLNAIYYKPSKETNYKDYYHLIIKDVVNNEKVLLTIEEPLINVYSVKPKYRNYEYYPMFKPLTECDKVLVKRKDLLKEIAKLGGDKYIDFYNECRKNRLFNYIKNLHKCPYILATDYDPEDYARIEWNLNYMEKNVTRSLSSIYLDIEVDGIDIVGIPEAGSCPINACSMVDEESKRVYVLLLRNSKYSGQEEFENNIDKFIEDCHDNFDENFGSFEYIFYMFDEEIKLIKAIFSIINKLKRDFVLIWNIDFDIPFIIKRIKELNYDPKEVMCSPDFEVKKLSYRKDYKHFDLKHKKNVFEISSYSVYIDQMDLYIKIRKSQSELKSFKLNKIAQDEIGDTKYDYHEDGNIKTLPYNNYHKFVLYNIKDTLLQYGINKKTHDTDTLFSRAYDNVTKYSSVFSQTVFLKNRSYLEYFEQGLIIGNNNNTKYEEYSDDKNNDEKNDTDEEENDTEGVRYEGAIVGDPKNVEASGILINSVRSKFVHDDVIDLDATAMYPSIQRAHNICPNSLIGKIIIEGFDHLNPNPSDKKFDAGRLFLEDYMTGDRTIFCNKFFNLPTTEELIEKFEKELRE